MNAEKIINITTAVTCNTPETLQVVRPNEWTIKEFSVFMKTTERTIQRYIKEDRFIEVYPKYEVVYISERRQIIRLKTKEVKVLTSDIAIPEKNNTPESAKEVGLAKFGLVKAYRMLTTEYKEKGLTVNDAKQEFEHLVKRNYYPWHLGVVGNFSLKSLLRWDKVLRENLDDYHMLIPEYDYTKGRNLKTIYVDDKAIEFDSVGKPKGTHAAKVEFYQRSLSDAEAGTLLKLYLNARRPTKGACICELLNAMKKAGLQIKNQSIYYRFLKDFEDMNNDLCVMIREGKKAFNDKLNLSIRRDLDELEACECWFTDGHTIEIFVRNPFTGKLCKPTVIGYYDWKTGYLVGFDIKITENTTSIASALRNSILELGATPRTIYGDNGKAFVSKYFTYEPKPGEIEEINKQIIGIFSRLGIDYVRAKAYNAQAKVIERFWLILQERWEVWSPSFAGRNALDKPAYMNRNEKEHKKMHELETGGKVLEIRDLINTLNEFRDNYHEKQCIHVPGKTIKQAWDEGLNEYQEKYPERIISDATELNNLMLAWHRPMQVRKGVVEIDSIRYYDKRLLPLAGQRVEIRLDLFDARYIIVISKHGAFKCEAISDIPALVKNCPADSFYRDELKRQMAIKRKNEKDQFLKAKGLSEAFGDTLLKLNIPGAEMPKQIIEEVTETIKPINKKKELKHAWDV